MRKIRNNRAVNDIVGTVILLGIAISLFSVLTFVVVSYPFNESPSSVNLVGTIDSDRVILEHRGGESLGLDTEVVFFIGGLRQTVKVGDGNYLRDEFKDDGYWNIGEDLVFITGDLTDKQVEVCVVEEKTKSVIMQGFLQGGVSSINSLETYVNPIDPYLVGSNPLHLEATGNQYLESVELWYRYSADNISWADPVLNSTKYPPYWEWDFYFPLGAGYYSFYSIGKFGEMSEDIPSVPDTYCCFNPGPEITNIYPENNEIDIPILPALSVTVFDQNGDEMDIHWFSNSSGSWEEFGVNYSVNDGTYYMIDNNHDCYNRTYYWYISIDDGVNTIDSPVYHFTTEEINTFVNSLPYEVTNSPFVITASGPGDLDDVTLWYRYNNGGWTTLTYDDFEQGWGNYTSGGYNSYIYDGGEYAHQGNNAAAIQKYGDSANFYHSNGINIDTSDYISIKIDFWFLFDSLEYNEGFILKYYDGSNWLDISSYYHTYYSYPNYEFFHKTVWINESDYDFPSNMRIGFQSDASWQTDDTYIDQIYVNATDGLSLSDYVTFTTDDDNPWEWNFNFPDGEGLYEFCSIGKKTGSTDETIPITPDAFCYYNPGG